MIKEPWYTSPQMIKAPVDAQYLPENRRFQGIPSIESVSSSRLFAAWQIGGDKEPHEDNCCAIAVSDDGGNSWTDPIFVLDHHVRAVRLCNPVLWLDPLNRLWLFWSQSNSGETEKMGVWAIRCDNSNAPIHALVWTEPKRCSDFIIINKPIVTPSGKWLYTAQDFGNRQWTYTFCSTDNGENFSPVGKAKSNHPNCYFSETMLLMSENTLLQFSRLENGAVSGGMEKAISTDDGETWTDFEQTDGAPFQGPGTRFFLRRLKSGNILFVNNNHTERRTNLTAHISMDDGKTWSSLLLDNREKISYPDGCECDGVITVIYDRDRGVEREILTVSFTEEDVINHKAPYVRCISKGLSE